MVSIRSSLVAVLAAATLTLPVATPPASLADPGGTGAQTAAPRATVDLRQPQDLPVGDAPRVAWLDYPSGAGPIYRPDEEPLPVGPGRAPEHLMQVPGGYLVTVDDQTVRFIGDDGTTRELLDVHKPRYVSDTVASPDGGLVAITTLDVDDGSDRVDVRRTADGELVVRHRFAIPVTVASLGRDRALLTPHWNIYAAPTPHLRTRWWNLRTGRLRLIDDAGPVRRGFGYTDAPGDLTAGQVALVRHDHDRVVTLPRRTDRAWRTRAHEWVLSWSPDDRFVITAADHSQGGWDQLTIRRAGNGTPVTLFQGEGNLYTDSAWSPVWESASTFVFYAGYNCQFEDGGDCPSRTVVRCSVRGACEQVAQPDGVYSTQERRLPPS